jgi:hypothetical protein
MTYFPSSGPASGWTAIETVTISNQATVEMDLSGSYKCYRLHLDNIISINDDRRLLLRFSTDGGSTFLSAGTDYAFNTFGVSEQSTIANGDVANDSILLNRFFVPTTMGTGTAESFNAIVHIHNPNQTTRSICMTSQAGCLDALPLIAGLNTRGNLIDNIDEVDAVQLLAHTGNLSTGRVSLYGLGLS